MPQIAPDRARRIFPEQNWYCHYCQCVMLDCSALPAKGSPALAVLAESLGIAPYSPRWIGKIKQHCATIDHIAPQILGGSDDQNNLVGACGYCNSFKADKDERTAKAELTALVKAGQHPCHKAHPNFS